MINVFIFQLIIKLILMYTGGVLLNSQKEEPEIYIVFNIPKVSKTHKIKRWLSIPSALCQPGRLSGKDNILSVQKLRIVSDQICPDKPLIF